MTTGTFEDNALYQLGQTLARGGQHSTATALRLLAQAGYSSLDDVDNTPDWLLLAIRGIGVGRLESVRRLSREEWQTPSPQELHASRWFLSAARLALRSWSRETLLSVVNDPTVRLPAAPSAESQVTLDAFAAATRTALRYHRLQDLIDMLEPDGANPGRSQTLHPKSPENPVESSDPQPSDEGHTLQASRPYDASDRYAYSTRKRHEIVEQYRAERDRGLVIHKDRWARTRYHISGRTLLNYEREFPE